VQSSLPHGEPRRLALRPCAGAQSIGQAAGKWDLSHRLSIVMCKSRVLGCGRHGKRKIRQQANVATGG
jgi:hypothetical protein